MIASSPPLSALAWVRSCSSYTPGARPPRSLPGWRHAFPKTKLATSSLPRRADARNEQTESNWRSRNPGREGYVGAKVEDLTPKTKLQGYYEHDYESLLTVLKKNRKKLDNRSCPPGAGRDASGRVRWVASQASALAGEDREDRQADRCHRVPALRAHGRGDQDRGGERKY